MQSNIIIYLDQQQEKWAFGWQNYFLTSAQKWELDFYIGAWILTILTFIAKTTKVEHKKAIEELGIEFTDIEQSLIEMGYSLIKQGYVENRLKD